MKTMMHSIAVLGCVAMVGNAAPAYPEERAAGGGDDGRIFTINFVGERSAAVTLHYKAYGKGDGAKSAMILMESLKRRLAGKGFERLRAEDAGQGAVHGYSVFIVGDTGYSEKTRALKKRDGDLTAVIVENEKVAAVSTAPAQGSEVEYQRIERLADEIMTRLLFHSYI